MKFGKRFDEAKIPEWEDFYISYRMLKKLLSPYKVLSKHYLKFTVENSTVAVHNYKDEDLKSLECFAENFEKLLFSDLEKMLVFYVTKLDQAIGKYRKLEINLVIYKQREKSVRPNVKDEQFSMLKDAFQTLIKELKLLTDYMNINLEAFYKILKKQDKSTAKFLEKSDLKDRFEKCLQEIQIYAMRDRLSNFLYSVENEYLTTFFKDRSQGTVELRKIFQGSMISRNETFWFGLYLGFTALLLILIIILAWDQDQDIDQNTLFKKIFPMFRGMAVIILYMWLLTWNVYGWLKSHVNYKLIFRFNYHSSSLSQILKRVAGFSTLLMLSILWYLIIDGDQGKFSRVIDFIPKEIIPLITWCAFILYMIFPHRRYLGGQGRIYFFRLLRDILKTPFIPTVFPVAWATDQLASMVAPLKDVEYTFCFYIAYFFGDEAQIQECQSSKRVTKGVIVAIIPLILRALQSLRQAYDRKPNRRDPLLNFGKYMVSMTVSILSYLVTVFNNGLAPLLVWIVFAAISTIYSYYWDLRKDWAFLEPNAKHRFLRKQLAYKRIPLYYVAIVLNLVLRLAWILSISPGITAQLLRPELFGLIIGCAEIFRRCIWNFFRVEKEHIANVGNFSAVQEMKLPYSDIHLDENVEEEIFVSNIQNLMEKSSRLPKPVNHPVYGPSSNSDDQMTKEETSPEKQATRSTSKARMYLHNLKKFKNLSKITFNLIKLHKTKKDVDDVEWDLSKYRKGSRQFYLLEKEISKFKHTIPKKENKFEVVAYDKNSHSTSQTKLHDQNSSIDEVHHKNHNTNQIKSTKKHSQFSQKEAEIQMTVSKKKSYHEDEPTDKTQSRSNQDHHEIDMSRNPSKYDRSSSTLFKANQENDGHSPSVLQLPLPDDEMKENPELGASTPKELVYVTNRESQDQISKIRNVIQNQTRTPPKYLKPTKSLSHPVMGLQGLSGVKNPKPQGNILFAVDEFHKNLSTKNKNSEYRNEDFVSPAFENPKLASINIHIEESDQNLSKTNEGIKISVTDHSFSENPKRIGSSHNNPSTANEDF